MTCLVFDLPGIPTCGVSSWMTTLKAILYSKASIKYRSQSRTARKRKKVIGREGTTQARAVNSSQSAVVSQNGRSDPALAGNAARVNRPVVRGPQSLIFPTMVALGCWGMAFTFLFLSNEPNRTIYG